MQIRTEEAADLIEIAALTTLAFAGAQHTSGTEADILWNLRHSEALSLSLVAENRGALLGHLAFSPVTFAGANSTVQGWFGLGPLSVRPEAQRSGIGSALMREGLRRLRDLGAAGCVVLGDPDFYCRFGFAAGTGPVYPGVPSECFMAQAFTGEAPAGDVIYHPAFSA